MGVYLGGPTTIDDYSALQGPAPDGFHVPLTTEWQAVYGIWTALGGGSSDGTNFGIALKLPFAGYRDRLNSNVNNQGSKGNYWSSTRNNEHRAYYLYFGSSSINPQNDSYRSGAFSVRCFKNSPIVPTSNWTKLYGTSIEAGGIFWSSADGLISLSSDGSNWITIMDKNLGATTVWDSGDTLSGANCGKYYQWGNNYGFPRTGTIANQSTTQVDASNYGPGNYYSSDTFIKSNGRWDTTDNGNLRGGETGVQPKTVYPELKNAYIGEVWTPGANTIAYYPLKENLNDIVGNHNMSNSGITFSDGFAVLDGNQRATVPSVTGWKTLAFWFKKTNDYNGMILSQGDTGGYIQLRTNGFSAAGTGGGSFNADFTAGGSTPSNVWRCCVVSQNVANNSGASSGSMKFYLSDFGGVSGIRQYDTTAHYLNWSIADFGWSGNASFPYALISNVSRFVVDGDEWSLSDCEDFYNYTKADYGY